MLVLDGDDLLAEAAFVARMPGFLPVLGGSANIVTGTVSACSATMPAITPGRALAPDALGDRIDRFYRAARGLCGSREEAEDLVRELFARVLRKPRVLRFEDDLGYLLRVLRTTFSSTRSGRGGRRGGLLPRGGREAAGSRGDDHLPPASRPPAHRSVADRADSQHRGSDCPKPRAGRLAPRVQRAWRAERSGRRGMTAAGIRIELGGRRAASTRCAGCGWSYIITIVR